MDRDGGVVGAAVVLAGRCEDGAMRRRREESCIGLIALAVFAYLVYRFELHRVFVEHMFRAGRQAVGVE